MDRVVSRIKDLWFFQCRKKQKIENGLIRKIRKQPNPKTTEDKLFDLMENRLNCQRVIDENDS